MKINKTQDIESIFYIIGNKFRDISFLQEVSLRKENFIPYIQAYPWDATTLSHGLPGFVCFFSEMDWYFPKDGWDQKTHEALKILVQEIESRGIHNTTLFSGLAGICSATYLASKGGSVYQTLLTKLHLHLLSQVQSTFLTPIEETAQKGEPISQMLLDTMTGITGLLSYFLQYLRDEETIIIARKLMQILVNITKPIQWKGCLLEGWISPPEFLLRKEVQEVYLGGCFDTGLAHGVAGYLSILSKGYECGIRVDGQEEAIQKVVNWFLDLQQTVGNIPKVWPSRFAFSPTEKHHVKIISTFYRDGWCYGSPGIGLALLRASKALRDPSLHNFSCSLLEAACIRYQQEKNLDCVSFCHGLSGLLCMVHQMYLETGSEILKMTSQRLISDIVEKYDDELPFGFKCLASIPGDTEKTVPVDNAGLLDGTLGVVMSLLFAQQSCPRPWTSLFLIG